MEAAAFATTATPRPFTLAIALRLAVAVIAASATASVSAAPASLLYQFSQWSRIGHHRSHRPHSPGTMSHIQIDGFRLHEPLYAQSTKGSHFDLPASLQPS